VNVLVFLAFVLAILSCLMIGQTGFAIFFAVLMIFCIGGSSE
jgi:hypothetical protein